MDQIKQLIDQYGPQVWGNIAAPVWEAALRKAVADGLTDIVWMVALGVTAVFAYRQSVGIWRWNKSEDAKQTGDAKEFPYAFGRGEASSGYTIASVLLGAAVPVLALVAIFAATDAIQHLVNPQWFAIQNLLGAIKR